MIRLSNSELLRDLEKRVADLEQMNNEIAFHLDKIVTILLSLDEFSEMEEE